MWYQRRFRKASGGENPSRGGEQDGHHITLNVSKVKSEQGLCNPKRGDKLDGIARVCESRNTGAQPLAEPQTRH